jgi:chaperonin GroEL (HSP60 family)
LTVLDASDGSRRLDLRDIRVVCKVGGTIDDSELVAGCVFDQKVRDLVGLT